MGDAAAASSASASAPKTDYTITINGHRIGINLDDPRSMESGNLLAEAIHLIDRACPMFGEMTYRAIVDLGKLTIKQLQGLVDVFSKDPFSRRVPSTAPFREKRERYAAVLKAVVKACEGVHSEEWAKEELRLFDATYREYARAEGHFRMGEDDEDDGEEMGGAREKEAAPYWEHEDDHDDRELSGDD